MGVLLAVTGLLAALSLYQWGVYLDTSRTARATYAQVSTLEESRPADVQSQIARDKAAAGNLKKKNLFIPPEPPRNPVTEVAGILGNEALIDGQWYKTGAKVGEGTNAALIVAIEPTKVRVKWNGRETEFLPIYATSGGSTARASGPGSAGLGGGRRGAPSMVRSEATPVRSVGSRRGGPPPEEMAAFMEKMKNASPEERQRLSEEMRQRYSGQSP